MSLELKPIADAISRALRRHRSALVQEKDLQEIISIALSQAGFAHDREVRLGPTERLDFLLTANAVAIEVKKDKAGLDVWRQVARYLEHDTVAGCIVIAPRIDIIRSPTLAGKPIWALPLWKYLF